MTGPATTALPLDEVAIEHLPRGYAVHAVLFRDVRNAPFLQAQLVARNPVFEYALVDAAAVVSRAHLLAAVFRAVLAHAAGTLKTPNVHAETVLSLSPSLNIAEAYRRFGVTAATQDLVVAKVLCGDDGDARAAAAAAARAHLAAAVVGTAVPLTDAHVRGCTDLRRVQKYYKLHGVAAAAGADDAARREVEALVLGGMALRGL